MKEITEEEVRQVLNTFHKGKSPRQDGFTLEFFLGFYDTINDDIL